MGLTDWILLMLVFPLCTMLPLLHDWLREQRELKRWDARPIEQPAHKLKKPRKRKATKGSLLVLGVIYAEQVECLRRVIITQDSYRKKALRAHKKVRRAQMMEALELADIRRWARKAAIQAKRERSLRAAA
jgi:hypothetical protein